MGETFVPTRRGRTGKPGGRTKFDFHPYADGDLTLAPEAVIEQCRAIATDPTTEWEVLLRLSYARDRMTSLWLSENPSSSADILDIIAEVDDPAVLKNIARHPRTIEETLTVLLADPRPDVREVVAVNPRLVRNDQVRAANDPDLGVQLALITNPKLDPFAAEQLRRSTFAETRERMTAHDAQKEALR